jgi:Uma2 family endonuclease
MAAKSAEYRQFGIENIWIIDPERRMAWRYTGTGLEEVRTGKLDVPETPIQIVLSEMFAELTS